MGGLRQFSPALSVSLSIYISCPAPPARIPYRIVSYPTSSNPIPCGFVRPQELPAVQPVDPATVPAAVPAEEAPPAPQTSTVPPRSDPSAPQPDVASPEQTKPRPAPAVPGQAITGLRVLGVLLISAADLPKMDILGSCDGFCVVDFGGRQQTTETRKNCLDPVWNDPEFLFHISGGADTGPLTVQVWDWERIGNNRLVGTHVFPSAEVAAMRAQPVGWEQEVTVPLVDNKGAAVIGYSKRRTTLRLRFRLLEGPPVGPPSPMDNAAKVNSGSLPMRA